mmetsp:Transcript_16669/g.52173  ORF Transcript_16669/g.52173 Transcript_16669/m.52173 type:complete len:214 (+) Transcript_16669:178-819(+)
MDVCRRLGSPSLLGHSCSLQCLPSAARHRVHKGFMDARLHDAACLATNACFALSMATTPTTAPCLSSATGHAAIHELHARVPRALLQLLVEVARVPDLCLDSVVAAGVSEHGGSLTAILDKIIGVRSPRADNVRPGPCGHHLLRLPMLDAIDEVGFERPSHIPDDPDVKVGLRVSHLRELADSARQRWLMPVPELLLQLGDGHLLAHGAPSLV